jgi:imidazolonepropionase
MGNLLVVNIGELVTPQGRRARRGDAMGELLRIRNAFLEIRDGKIVGLGPMDEAPRDFPGNVLDVGGRAVTPGLVDPHTHLVFAGSRVEEYLHRARGERYTGGGILVTAEATRAATEDELVELAVPRLRKMLRCGVTAMEAKSGYGLSPLAEEKILRAIKRLEGLAPQRIVPTFLGAHAFPPDYGREEYIDLLVGEMIPRVAEERLARFCDVFCDRGFYTVDEARRILEAGARHRLVPKVHADELAPVGAAELAAEVGAISADHLLHVSDAGIKALAETNTVAVLLPGTAFVIEEPYPPARKLLEAGVPLALSTDFNPGSSPVLSLPFVMRLGVLKLKLSPEETLCASTLNAACAIGLAHEVGSLEPGKSGDLVVWDLRDIRELFYWFGDDVAWQVVIGGEAVWASP